MAAKTVASKVPVALPKKDETTSPAAGPALLAPEEALKAAIGSKLRVTRTWCRDQPFEGYLHTADTQFNWIILWLPTSSSPNNAAPNYGSPLPPTGAIKVILLNQIEAVQILALPTLEQASATPDLNNISSIDTRLGELRLEKNMRAEQERLARKGPKGTSPTDQALFEALARTMPARWEGTRMVISDQYVIDKPYTRDNVSLVDEKVGKAGLDRIKKIVDMEKSKIALRMGGDVTGGAKATPKKGG